MECSVCFQDYAETGDKLPRLLPCGHDNCTGCLRGLYKNSSTLSTVRHLACPRCRQRHYRKPEDLPVVYSLIGRRENEELANNRICQKASCQSRSAHQCLHCHMWLCTPHNTAHKEELVERCDVRRRNLKIRQQIIKKYREDAGKRITGKEKLSKEITLCIAHLTSIKKEIEDEVATAVSAVKAFDKEVAKQEAKTIVIEEDSDDIEEQWQRNCDLQCHQEALERLRLNQVASRMCYDATKIRQVQDCVLKLRYPDSTSSDSDETSDEED